jgi:hypothetical protein
LRNVLILRHHLPALLSVEVAQFGVKEAVEEERISLRLEVQLVVQIKMSTCKQAVTLVCCRSNVLATHLASLVAKAQNSNTPGTSGCSL